MGVHNNNPINLREVYGLWKGEFLNIFFTEPHVIIKLDAILKIPYD